MAEKIKPLMVIWSPKASANLDDIIAYLKQSWTDKVIRAFFANMELAVESNSVSIFSTEKNYCHSPVVGYPTASA